MDDGVTIVNITVNVRTEEGDNLEIVGEVIDPDILINSRPKKQWGVGGSKHICPKISTCPIIWSHDDIQILAES